MIDLSVYRMLVILSHPDDVSYANGGILDKFVHQGVQVVVLAVTQGKIRNPSPASDAIEKIGEENYFHSANSIGVEVHFLDYQENELTTSNFHGLLEQIASWIDTVQPQVVLTFSPVGVSYHSDHILISHVVTQIITHYFSDVCIIYLAQPETTVINSGISASEIHLDRQLLSKDITNFTLEKYQESQSYASRKHSLRSKPKVILDEISYYGNFTIGHSMIDTDNIFDCFKTSK